MSVKRSYAGQRDRRVQVVRVSNTKDAIGGAVGSSESIGFFWASMQDLSGVEDEEGKVLHIVNRTYTIPYLTIVKTSGEEMEVIDEGENFKIYHVQEIGRKHQLLLKCTYTKRE